MQLNATLRTTEEPLEDDFEVIGDGLGQIAFTDSEADDDNGSTASSIICVASREHTKEKMPEEAVETQTEGTGFETDSDTEELTEDETIQFFILSGRRTARDYTESFTRKLEKGAAEITLRMSTEPTNSGKLKAAQEKFELIGKYRFQLHAVRVAISTQLSDAGIIARMGASRSQQYQDKLNDNLEFQDELEEIFDETRNMRDEQRQMIQAIRAKDDVNRIDHPQHGHLTWTVCYHDQCMVHYGAKVNAGRFPQKKLSVHWPELDAQNTTREETPGPEDKPAKN